MPNRGKVELDPVTRVQIYADLLIVLQTESQFPVIFAPDHGMSLAFVAP